MRRDIRLRKQAAVTGSAEKLAKHRLTVGAVAEDATAATANAHYAAPPHISLLHPRCEAVIHQMITIS